MNKKLLPRRKISVSVIAMQAFIVSLVALHEFTGVEISAVLSAECTALVGLVAAYFTPATKGE